MSEAIKTAFDEYLSTHLPSTQSFHPHFNASLAWILNAGGKHFRAQLLLGVAQAFSKKAKIKKSALKAALAVELLHTYSLIHDDLPAMDNAPLRRGVMTLHIKYDEATAILAGDALNTQAFYELSKIKNAKLSRKLSKILARNGGLNGMVIGQAIDCYFENKKLDLGQLKFLHLHKTASLIAACMQMGAAIAKKGKKAQKSVYELGLKLGLAFQIHDDIIDASASQSDAGKPVNNDTSKNSFTNLLGLSGAKAARDELKAQILKEGDFKELKPLLDDLMQKYLKDNNV